MPPVYCKSKAAMISPAVSPTATDAVNVLTARDDVNSPRLTSPASTHASSGNVKPFNLAALPVPELTCKLILAPFYFGGYNSLIQTISKHKTHKATGHFSALSVHEEWLGSRVVSMLTAKNQDRLQNPTLCNRVWVTFTFFLSVHEFTCKFMFVPFLFWRIRATRL